MFTGIVSAVGKIDNIERRGTDCRLHVAVGDLDMDDVALGDSIAVSGACLTVVEFDDSSFVADVSAETLSLTILDSFTAGRSVNLEKALALGERLGGHLVSGHVDGVGALVSQAAEGRSVQLRFSAPVELAGFIAKKGSIAIDGVSLTVNRVENLEFEVNIVPHTLQLTTLGGMDVGQKVNLEIDLIARYVARLQEFRADNPGITEETLRRNGFM